MTEVRAALAGLPAGRSLDVLVCAFSETDATAYEAKLQALELPE
jgi:hypothetical protein